MSITVPGRGSASTLTGALAGVVTTALLLGAVGAAPAQARPSVSPLGSPLVERVLPVGEVVALAPDATVVKVAESAYGGTVAVLWTIPAPSGTQVWARLKDDGVWSAAVQLSTTGVAAARPDSDIDSDGSLLVSWAEGPGTGDRVVTRRLTSTGAGPRQVIAVALTDGPVVGAGTHQDAVVWTARDGLSEQPFAAVDAGSGFAAPARVSSRTWRYDVLPGTLAVNSDGPQSHVLYLSRDTDTEQVQSSWSVLDPQRSPAWQAVDDLGQRQDLTPAPHPPSVAVDDAHRAVLVLTNQQGAVRYPTAQLWTPGPGAPADRLADPVSLEDPDASGQDAFVGVRNRQGIVIGAHGGSPGLLTRLLAPADTVVGQVNTSAVSSACAGYDDWFFAWPLDVPEIHCAVADQASAPQIWSANTGPSVALAVDPTVGGSLSVDVPTPLVPVVVVTERPAAGGNVVWLLDHTGGGDDRPHPQLPFVAKGAPKVSGTVMVNHTVSASTGTWSPTPSDVTYRWLVDGVTQAGQTGPRLKVTAAMQGRRISVRVFVGREGYEDASAVSAQTARVAAYSPLPFRRLTSPKVTGKAKVGRKLTVRTGTYSPSPEKTTVRWYVNGKAVKGGTKRTLKLTKKMRGKKVSVKVTVSRSLYRTQSVTVKVKGKVKR